MINKKSSVQTSPSLRQLCLWSVRPGRLGGSSSHRPWHWRAACLWFPQTPPAPVSQLPLTLWPRRGISVVCTSACLYRNNAQFVYISPARYITVAKSLESKLRAKHCQSKQSQPSCTWCFSQMVNTFNVLFHKNNIGIFSKQQPCDHLQIQVGLFFFYNYLCLIGWGGGGGGGGGRRGSLFFKQDLWTPDNASNKSYVLHEIHYQGQMLKTTSTILPMRILTPTVKRHMLIQTEVGADSGEEADNALPSHEPQQHESDTYMRKRSTILAETPCLNILSEVFSPFSFSFTPEKTTASDTSLAFCV